MDIDRVSTLKANLDSLKSRLKNFTVCDRNGQKIGEVRDLTLDPEQNLSLIVAQPDIHKGYRFLSLGSKLIQKIEGQPRTVTVNLSQEDVSYLPEYRFPQLEKEQPATLPLTTSRPPQPVAPLEAQAKELAIATASTPSLVESRVDDLLKHRPTSKVTTESIDQEELLPGETANLSTGTDHSAITVTPPVSTESAVDTTASSEQSPSQPQDATGSVFTDSKTLTLLEERLFVNHQRRKIGEVIIRKEIETQMVEVPIRREKLIVERIGENPERLAEIDLSQGEISGVEIREDSGFSPTQQPTVRAEFTSPKTASQLLDAIAKLHHHNCKSIRIELVLNDSKLQDTYQEWVQLYGGNST
jgi:uncharacterized protein (TIGR02271 family)